MPRVLLRSRSEITCLELTDICRPRSVTPRAKQRVARDAMHVHYADIPHRITYN